MATEGTASRTYSRPPLPSDEPISARPSAQPGAPAGTCTSRCFPGPGVQADRAAALPGPERGDRAVDHVHDLLHRAVVRRGPVGDDHDDGDVVRRRAGG